MPPPIRTARLRWASRWGAVGWLGRLDLGFVSGRLYPIQSRQGTRDMPSNKSPARAPCFPMFRRAFPGPPRPASRGPVGYVWPRRILLERVSRCPKESSHRMRKSSEPGAGPWLGIWGNKCTDVAFPALSGRHSGGSSEKGSFVLERKLSKPVVHAGRAWMGLKEAPGRVGRSSWAKSTIEAGSLLEQVVQDGPRMVPHKKESKSV